ncbi:hypothetical protein [Oceanobacillus luteolus]|uniref:Uncharacterized protein n=1 Tax=Oceanobacillus luteolus TaxID=1274358 RepID=A0ABW4HT67_9BACI
MEKSAKVILKEIQQKAKEMGTYYIISDIYWPFGGSWEQKIAEEMGANDLIWKDIFKLNERYQRFIHYVLEEKPNWKVIKTINFADNSIEIVEESDSGERRSRLIQAPHGDFC